MTSKKETTYRYQRDFSRMHKAMYDVPSRVQRGEKVVSVLADFFRHRGVNPKSLTLLDIGCSTGILASHYVRHFGFAIGSDIDTHSVRHAQTDHRRHGARLLIADSMRLPFGDANFDVVTCTHIYENMPDAARLIAEIYRVLRPGAQHNEKAAQ